MKNLLTNLHHLAQFLKISGDEIEEAEFVKILSPLIGHLHDLVVSIEQGCLSQPIPTVLVIQ